MSFVGRLILQGGAVPKKDTISKHKHKAELVLVQ